MVFSRVKRKKRDCSRVYVWGQRGARRRRNSTKAAAHHAYGGLPLCAVPLCDVDDLERGGLLHRPLLTPPIIFPSQRSSVHILTLLANES